MKAALASILISVTSCSNWEYLRDLKRIDGSNRIGAAWANPAFSGTVNHIRSLETCHAKRSEWKASDGCHFIVKETTMSSPNDLDKALKSRCYRPWIKEHAIRLQRNSSFAALYEFPGLYRILVFFGPDGRSSDTIRDP